MLKMMLYFWGVLILHRYNFFLFLLLVYRKGSGTSNGGEQELQGPQFARLLSKSNYVTSATH